MWIPKPTTVCHPVEIANSRLPEVSNDSVPKVVAEPLRSFAVIAETPKPHQERVGSPIVEIAKSALPEASRVTDPNVMVGTSRSSTIPETSSSKLRLKVVEEPPRL